MLYKLLLLVFLFPILSIQGQEHTITPSQFGFTGLIYTPTAYIAEWKTIDASFTHFSKETSFTYQSGIKTERAFNINFAFMPRVELSIKLTRPYSNLRPDYQPGSRQLRNWGIGDRSYSLRIHLLEEKKNRPSLVIGIQDPFANLAFFHTNYLVTSKIFKVDQFHIATSIGYGLSWEDTRGNYLQGLFGGVQLNWKNLNGMIEYDANNLNVGLGYQFKKRLFINIAFIDTKYFSGNISYRFLLN